ncbi:MAG: hypothetical protein R2851_09860 [Caldilineaceae bacterium]
MLRRMLMPRIRATDAGRRARRAVLALLVLGALLVAPLQAPRAAVAQSGYTYQECQTVDADALGAEIETLALAVLQAEGAPSTCRPWSRVSGRPWAWTPSSRRRWTPPWPHSWSRNRIGSASSPAGPRPRPRS